MQFLQLLSIFIHFQSIFTHFQPFTAIFSQLEAFIAFIQPFPIISINCQALPVNSNSISKILKIENFLKFNVYCGPQLGFRAHSDVLSDAGSLEARATFWTHSAVGFCPQLLCCVPEASENCSIIFRIIWKMKILK